MDVEKLIKCSDCDAKFPTTELLQVHQRRHEMSLNLSLKPSSSSSSSLLTPSILTKGSLSAGILGFVDETPTPTRFIRICEEVGLFQDLQNVNPFDEDFKKAASSATATPSGEGNAFDFSFSSALVGGITPTSIRNVTSRSKRRYSDQDSLNTPQVFPYLSVSSGGYHLQTLSTNTASISACLTPTPQTALTQESLRSVLQIETPTTPTTTYNHEEHVSIIAYTSAISQQTNKGENSSKNNEAISALPVSGGLSGTAKSPDKSKSPSSERPVQESSTLSLSKNTSSYNCNEGHTGSRISLLKIRSKSHLKLDLKTVISRRSKKVLNDKVHGGAMKTPDSSEIISPNAGGKQETKRAILERKRAAAHRSRERRKQWIYGLESRCRALEALLAKSQAEVSHLKTENETLRSQIKDGSTEVEAPAKVTSSAISNSFTFIHQSCQTDFSSTTFCNQEPLLDSEGTSSGGTGDMIAAIVTPITLPTVKAKRGRPRKGQERRVPILSVPIASSEDAAKPLPKIPILPLPNRRQLPVLKKV